MPGKVLLFGANSFLAKGFNSLYQDVFDIENIYKSNPKADLNFDFINDDAPAFTKKLNGPYKAVLFFQGINPSVGAKDIDETHFANMLKVNLIVPSLLVKELADKLEDGALVLFVSSVSRKKGSYDPSYASAKAGVVGLMHSLANAWPGVRFNCVSPGLIQGSPVYQGMTDEQRQKHASKMFNKTFIKAEDVVKVAAELIENKGINRTIIDIDGGYHI